jgi:hypothetical protein
LENITSFKPILNDKANKYFFEKLINCDCINLKNGLLAPCPLAFTIGYYNDRFGKKYPTNFNFVNIYEEGMTGKKALLTLQKPSKLCDFCLHYRDDLPYRKWEKSNKEVSLKDWM